VKYGSTPFLGIILTLSNHPPNLLPNTSFMKFDQKGKDYETLNAFSYSDWALGQFFGRAKHERYFSNTIFVLVADHGRVQEGKHPMVPARFHIAGLLYAPGVREVPPAYLNTTAGQTDILPTLLSLLGVPYRHASWGRDLFSLRSSDSGFATMTDGKSLGYLRTPYYLVERIGGNASLYDISRDPDLTHDLSAVYPDTLISLQSSARAYLETSVLLTKKRVGNTR
jgi:phosphoglycerol transferase MdoB-like AlkP superfamily enzyme